MTKNHRITILGAGLVGSLLSLYLARRGFTVDLYEKRPDLRRVKLSAGRSINLALAQRGLYPLEQLGLLPQVSKLYLPMRGRMIHDGSGHQDFQPYGQKDVEVIYSISRRDLNALLLDAAEESGRVHLHFQHECEHIDLTSKQLSLRDQLSGNMVTHPYDRLLSTDGSASLVRKLLFTAIAGENREEQLGHGYKELRMPPSAQGAFALAKEALHIWPRGEFMLIGLPNLDGSFTMTLFLPVLGEESFTSLKDTSKLLHFFNTHFADTLPLLPELADDFFANPTGQLATVRCYPWHYQDSVLLLGDAAHAIVPFHGQGMNCGFEDCAVLVHCLDTCSSWQETFEQFEKMRKPNCDAIADMALENYVEMRATVRDPQFQLQKQLAFQLEAMFPNLFIPRYSMVMFHRIPYQIAQARGRVQQEILNDACQGITSLAQIDWDKVNQLVHERLQGS